MDKQIVFAIVAAFGMATFWGFVGWWSHPSTWLPESRFIFAFSVIAAGAIAYVASRTHDTGDGHDGKD